MLDTHAFRLILLISLSFDVQENERKYGYATERQHRTTRLGFSASDVFAAFKNRFAKQFWAETVASDRYLTAWQPKTIENDVLKSAQQPERLATELSLQFKRELFSVFHSIGGSLRSARSHCDKRRMKQRLNEEKIWHRNVWFDFTDSIRWHGIRY